MHIAWGDAAAWAAAIFTGGALFAALWQIATERSARKASEAAAKTKAHRAQAELVSAWWGGRVPPTTTRRDDDDWLVLANRSEEPVYGVVASMVLVQGAGPTRGEEWWDESGHPRAAPLFSTTFHLVCVSVLPPGNWQVRVAAFSAGMHAHPGAEIAFVDRAGANWVRRGGGQLEELGSEPIDHFHIGRPVSFSELSAVT